MMLTIVTPRYRSAGRTRPLDTLCHLHTVRPWGALDVERPHRLL